MGTSRRSRVVTNGIALPIGLVSLLTARASVAADPCLVEVRGVPSAAWAGARAELEQLIRLGGGDCAVITLQVGAEDDARLVVRTRDGRRAERVLRDPDELAPTATALFITTGDATESAKTARHPETARRPETAHVPGPVSARDEAPAATGRAPAARPPREVVLLGVQAGKRYGSGGLASPVVGGFVSIDVRRWEIGVIGSAELGYERAGERDPQRPPSTSLGGGVLVGRREHAGPLDVLAGGRATLAFVTGQREVMTPRGRTFEQARNREEPRVGVYAGAVLPRLSAVRVRTEIAFDVVPGELGAAATEPPPLTPWWMASLQLGVELAR